ncbi:hypothetical protein PSTG_17695, partial [Puccinia striiformis f. sp. tritici PST-78]
RPLYSTQQSPIRLQHLKISGQIGASRQLLKQISTGGCIDQGFEWLGLLFRLLRHQTNISRIKIGGPFTEALVARIIDLGTQTAVSTSQGTSPKLLIPPAPKLLSPAAPNFSIPPAPMPFTVPKPAKFPLEPPPRLYKRL